MPGYPGSGLAQLIYEHQQISLFNNEIVGVGQASIAVRPAKETGHHHSFDGYAVEVSFGGAPGTFEVDIQAAETDADPYYVTIANVVSVNAHNVGRFQQSGGIPVTYLRAYILTLGNAVAATVRFSRA